MFCCRPAALALLITACSTFAIGQPVLMDSIAGHVAALMRSGGIPGLSLVIVRDGQETIQSFGYANANERRKVTDSTLFQIGSCSKAFTALLVAGLIDKGELDPATDIRQYLPWLELYYKGKPQKVTVDQLMHHTSGIPWSSISLIPESNASDALEKTVRRMNGIQLAHQPGKLFEYATVNYDILALIVQRVTGARFEDYMTSGLFDKLGLSHTSIGQPVDSGLMASGYKLSFFRPRPYHSPVFRGNNAAGYVITNGKDMAKWLRFQLGQYKADLYPLADLTHRRDTTVPLHGMSSYAMGWDVSLSGDGAIYHAGQNPNFTSYIILRPRERMAVAVMANSNSGYANVICNDVIRLMTGVKLEKEYAVNDNGDKIFSMASFFTGFYLLALLTFLASMIWSIRKGQRKYRRWSGAQWFRATVAFLLLLPAFSALALFPKAYANFNWPAMLVWAPGSFPIMIALILSAILLSYMVFVLGLCYPQPDKLKKHLPMALLLSIFSGLANMAVIAIVTSSLNSDMDLGYQLFYYALALGTYILGRKYVATVLMKVNTELIYDLRMRITEKIFSTTNQNFEKLDRGRIYTVLNDDIAAMADATNIFVAVVTNVFTAAAAFLYLGAIAFWATAVTVVVILAISFLYFRVTRSTNKYFEMARDTQNIFMRLLGGMIDGFKELSLHQGRKLEYRTDIDQTATEYRQKIMIASNRFINASLIGESMLVLLLGSVVFAVPRVFPGVSFQAIMSFVIVILFLIGPVNALLNAFPGIMRTRVAWNRIQTFLKDIPSTMDISRRPPRKLKEVRNLTLEGVQFSYKSSDNRQFSVGPIDLDIRRGEILFIIGANGSGKTTFAKLLAGLYEPGKGAIQINDEPVSAHELGEYFSAVFSPPYLFEKLYDIDTVHKTEIIDRYLKLLQLESKVQIEKGRYSTIELSGGQRKRLALLQCYLEDSPIYLFDEWAADQDPAYRQFFYRVMLPQMKKEGKIIIAITHDDHYFDVADRVMKMDDGKVEWIQDTRSGPALTKDVLFEKNF